jgi:hypothetical protein
MRYKTTLILMVILSVCLSQAYAGSDRRMGTAGAQELRIPVGARGTAMGGAIIADVSGVEAVHWNPAGLATLAGTEVMFSHQPYLADIKVNFVGVASNLEGFGSVAATVKIASIGEMEETTDAFPDGTGRIFSPTLSVLSLTYSRVLTYRVLFGVTGKFVYEKIFEVSASGVAFDIGFVYDPEWHGLKLGLAVRNYGPEMRFTGDGFNRPLGGRQAAPQSASFDLPSSFNLGLSYDLLNVNQSTASMSGTFCSNNYSQDMWQGGVEYVYDDRYALRVGYNYSDQNDWLYGVSLGGGVMVNIKETKLSVDYTWSDTELFNDNQYFTVKMLF